MRQPASLQFGEAGNTINIRSSIEPATAPMLKLNGGGDMYAYDVNGDGLNDVITSLDAHGWGLVWFEQIRNGDEITFQEHLIMSKQAENTDNPTESSSHSSTRLTSSISTAMVSKISLRVSVTELTTLPMRAREKTP